MGRVAFAAGTGRSQCSTAVPSRAEPSLRCRRIAMALHMAKRVAHKVLRSLMPYCKL